MKSRRKNTLEENLWKKKNYTGGKKKNWQKSVKGISEGSCYIKR